MRHQARALTLMAILLLNQIAFSQTAARPGHSSTLPSSKLGNAARIKEHSSSIDVLTKIESDSQFTPGPAVKDLLDSQIHQMTCEKNKLVLLGALPGPLETKATVATAYYDACMSAKKLPEPVSSPPSVYACRLPAPINLIEGHYQPPLNNIGKPSPTEEGDYKGICRKFDRQHW